MFVTNTLLFALHVFNVVHGDAVVGVTVALLHLRTRGVRMVNGDDILRFTIKRRRYRRVHEDAAAERILASMILIITLPP